jgi:hypothetical protein
MDGEQNGQRSGGAGEEGVETSQPGTAGGGSAAGGGGDGAGSSGTSGAGGGDAAGDGSSVAGGGAEGQNAIVSFSKDLIILDWSSSEEDAEAAITWARYHPSDPEALRVLEAIANNQSLGIRNGDTPVRRNAQTALRDLKTTLGVQ